MQVANASAALATVSVMDITRQTQHRRDRLAALLREHFADVKSDLGRALGYGSGAYVRQLLAGERPITEKLVAKVHTMQGGKFRGWFDGEPTQAPAAQEADVWPLRRITAAEWASLPEWAQGAIEEAAVQKMREIASEQAARQDDAVSTKQPATRAA